MKTEVKYCDFGSALLKCDSFTDVYVYLVETFL